MAKDPPEGRCRMGDVKRGDIVRKGGGPWTRVLDVEVTRTGIVTVTGKTAEQQAEVLVGGCLSLLDLRT